MQEKKSLDLVLNEMKSKIEISVGKYSSKLLREYICKSLHGYQLTDLQWRDLRVMAQEILISVGNKSVLKNKKILNEREVQAILEALIWLDSLAKINSCSRISFFEKIKMVDAPKLQSFKNILIKILRDKSLRFFIVAKKFKTIDDSNIPWFKDGNKKIKSHDFLVAISESFGGNYYLNEKTLYRYATIDLNLEGFKGVKKHKYSLIDFLKVRSTILSYNFHKREFKEQIKLDLKFEAWFSVECSKLDIQALGFCKN